MKYWYQKNLRFLQTVLRATDLIDYDAKGVVEYMKKANANVLVVNAGGVMDFFPNPLPLAKPNPFMKDGQDYLTDICKEIHAAIECKETVTEFCHLLIWHIDKNIIVSVSFGKCHQSFVCIVHCCGICIN